VTITNPLKIFEFTNFGKNGEKRSFFCCIFCYKSDRILYILLHITTKNPPVDKKIIRGKSAYQRVVCKHITLIQAPEGQFGCLL